MNSATAYPLAEADAARLPCGWEKRARGTLSDLAAGASHPPLVASAGPGGTTLPPSDNNPARADQVAAQSPGGGGVMLHAPANPSQAGLDPREVARIAAAYPPEAAGVPVWEREAFFTPLQLAAWEKRFGSGQP